MVDNLRYVVVDEFGLYCTLTGPDGTILSFDDDLASARVFTLDEVGSFLSARAKGNLKCPISVLPVKPTVKWELFNG